MMTKSMKRLAAFACMALALTACAPKAAPQPAPAETTAPAETAGPQIASAVLDADTDPFVVTIDLTGGWSVEFAIGAAYLYDKPSGVGDYAGATATLVSLEKDVYDDYIEQAKASKSFREVPDGVMYTDDSNEDLYFYEVEGGHYYMIVLQHDGGQDIDAILARISTRDF